MLYERCQCCRLLRRHGQVGVERGVVEHAEAFRGQVHLDRPRAAFVPGGAGGDASEEEEKGFVA